jgi:hypothetical protein
MEENNIRASEKGERRRSSARGDDAEQQWFWVKATYKAVHVGAARKRHLWERNVFIVRGPESASAIYPDAAGDPELREKAEKIAREKEHEYVAAGGDTIRWVFQRIEQIQPIFDQKIGEGTEVYWELFERVDKTPS